MIRKLKRLLFFLLLSIIPIAYLFFYRPMFNELRELAKENFMLISSTKYNAIEKYIDRCLEGANSVSSRAFIKEMIMEYKADNLDMSELKEQTYSRWLPGVQALDNIIYSARIVENEIIAEYGKTEFHFDDIKKIKYDDEEKNILIRSEIKEGQDVLGIDLLIFDMERIIQDLRHENIDLQIIAGSHKTKNIDDMNGILFIKDFNNIDSHLIISISEDILFDHIQKVARRSMMVFVLGILLVFSLTNSFIIRYANKLLLEYKNSKEKAEEATLAKSQFLANMSHELRTPINALTGFSDLLKYTKLDKTQKDYVNNISISADSLLELINDILDLSKIEAGKLELENVMTDILELAEQAVSIIRLKAEKKNLIIKTEIFDNVPAFAEIDPVRLKQILLNLLNNAVKFTDKGEIRLKICFEKIDENTGKFCFSIRDTGIGIKPEQKEKLFKVFSQADMSITRKYGGTGLGLVISGLLIEKMGGSIGFESEYNKGSEFYFNIEANYKRDFYKKPKNELETRKIRKCEKPVKILIVEDNPINMKLANKIVSNYFVNGEILEAVNGKEAIETVKKHKINLILMDIQMPEMDGLTATKIIREFDQMKDIPIIAVTAGVLKSEIDQCLKAGMDEVVKKPFKKDILYGIFDKIIFPNY